MPTTILIIGAVVLVAFVLFRGLFNFQLFPDLPSSEEIGDAFANLTGLP